jgi:hypothetical protein
LMNGHARRGRQSDDDWNGADFRDGEGEAFVVGDEDDDEEHRTRNVDLDRLEEEDGMRQR